MPRKGKFANKNTNASGMIYADSSKMQMYGTIDKALGNCHFKIISINEENFTASLCGNVKKGERVKSGDFVLFEPISEDEAGKYQIIHKYTPKEKKILEKEGCLAIVKEEEQVEEVDYDAFIFEGEEEETQQNTTLDVNENFIDDI